MNASRSTLAAMLVLLLPAAAAAQDAAAAEDMQDPCTAELTPVISGGQVQTTATFNRPFGDVTGIKGPEKSGLEIVRVIEHEPREMAAEEIPEEARAANPANLTDDAADSSSFRVNTSHMEPGRYEVTLSNDDGEKCSGELRVKSPSPATG